VTFDRSFGQEMNSGIAHHGAGRLDQAEAIYRNVLAQHPYHADALHLLGLIFHQRGDQEQATRLVADAIRLTPSAADMHANHGLIYFAMSRFAEAESELVEAVRLHPGHAEALNNLGSTLKALGRNDEAIECYRRAIAVRPDFLLAHINLAGILWEQRRLDEAAAEYRTVSSLTPDDSAAWFRLALLLHEMGKPQEAAANYRRVINLAPNTFEAHANLGNALRDLAEFEPAIARYREAVPLRPDPAECRLNLATGLLSIGLVDRAVEETRTAIRLKPDLDEAYTTMLLALQYRVHAPQEILGAHHQWAQARTLQLPPIRWPARARCTPDATGRLRVGFMSPDFYDHPIAYFLEPLLAEHDPTRLHFTCYASVARRDAFTGRLQTHADRWRDISTLAHERVAHLIDEDGIDILIDLAGHMAGSRLPVLARKPAPAQVSYLGYPSTTGLAQIDFRWTDGHADPPGLTEAQYTETLVRLPRTLACYAPPDAPPAGPLPAQRVGCAGHITFASFSNLAKIAPETIALWSPVLRSSAFPTHHWSADKL
jgi:predicted O-linked N-acetylglucosamine transferase (SPINDLY family)